LFSPTRLVDGRHDAHLTQVQFCKLLGVSLSCLRRYESGKYEPSGSVLKRMALATGRPMGWFLGDDSPAPGAIAAGDITADELEFLREWRTASPDTRMLIRETLRDALRVARACAS